MKTIRNIARRIVDLMARNLTAEDLHELTRKDWI